MGLALWLTSSNNGINTAVERCMASVRRDLGQHEPPSDPFPPHATLLSGLSIEEHGQVDAIWAKAQGMLAAWRKGRAENVDATTLDVPFDCLKSNGTYFQCLFIALVKTAPLLALHKAALEMYHPAAPPQNGDDNSDPISQQLKKWQPHVSLLYSALSRDVAEAHIRAMTERRGVCDSAEVGGSKSVHELKTDIKSTAIWMGSDDSLDATVKRSASQDWIAHFPVDRVELWSCQGPVGKWVRLREMTILE